MLPHQLISASCRRGVILPWFVQNTRPDRLELAGQLLMAYRQAAAQKESFTALDEFLTPLLNGAEDRRFALALRKLLDERSTFTSLADLDFPALRAPVFAATAKLLKSEIPLQSIEAWRSAVAAAAGPGNPLLQSGQLYADLPENDCLLQFDDLTAPQLLDRYNLALVQALLLTAARIDAHVATADAARLRRLFKYLRFFQLLSTIEADAPENPQGEILRLHLMVDGPASILDQSRRYGLQLAAFFPALCSVEHWSLEAEVTWKNRPVLLKLDETSKLVCPYHNFAAYVPDEIKLFHQHFRESSADWQIVGHTPFLRGPGKEVIIPDLSFQHPDGTLVHLELFNRWHGNGLAQRLEWLEHHPELPLILGVDKSLTRDETLAQRLENSPWFSQFGFLYHDYPTCEKTRRALEKRRK